MTRLGDMIRAALWTLITYAILVVLTIALAIGLSTMATWLAYTLQEFFL